MNSVYNIFGFEIRKAAVNPALSAPINYDGAVDNDVTTGAGAYGYYFDLNRKLVNEVELINKYRQMANIAEIDLAIEDIVNEAVIVEEFKEPVVLQFSDNSNIPDQVRDIIQQEFSYVLNLLNFQTNGHEIFRQWYVDGRYASQIVVDEAQLNEGIKEIRPLDPRKIKKVRDIIKQKNNGGTDVIVDVDEYYIYNDSGNTAAGTGIKLSPDTIIYSTSGLQDEYGNAISYLHKAIKPANQLRYMEDAALIYTLSRAPSRRVFYIDIGDMPKAKGDQYIQNIMNKYKNKIVYSSQTGEIKDDRVHQTMLEDFWLPRRSNGRTTEIQTLPSESISNQMDNVTYFLNKLYNSLNIPLSRLRPDANFSLGRTQEITRDELKFSKFIDRLRKRFSNVFLQALRVQLILKQIITPEEWEDVKTNIAFDFLRDNHFTELKETEILSNRLQMAEQIMPMVGIYFSPNFVRQKILRQSDDEIKRIRQENIMAMKAGELNQGNNNE